MAEGLNLDEQAAVRIAEREAAGIGPGPVTFRGETFALPDELPWTFTRALGDVARLEEEIGAIVIPEVRTTKAALKALATRDALAVKMRDALEAAVRALLGDDGLERFITLGAARADIVALLNGAPELIAGKTAGESPASVSKLPSTSRPSRQRSRRSTKAS